MAEVDRKVKLKSLDGREFEVESRVAEMSMTIKHMLEDLPDTDEAIPLPNISGAILEKVIAYCEHHKDDAAPEAPEDSSAPPEINVTGFDKELVTGIEQATLFDMILAANFLDIKPMLDLTCKAVADMIVGKTPDEIRETFGIKDDFTPEEKAQVIKENEWAREQR